MRKKKSKKRSEKPKHEIGDLVWFWSPQEKGPVQGVVVECYMHPFQMKEGIFYTYKILANEKLEKRRETSLYLTEEEVKPSFYINTSVLSTANVYYSSGKEQILEIEPISIPESIFSDILSFSYQVNQTGSSQRVTGSNDEKEE